MKLYVTPTSPFARIARIVVLEKGLEERVEIIPAQTRQTDSPYYAINPSGRVPYLVLDDSVGLEDSQLICAYLDHLDRSPALDHPEGDGNLESRRLEALARSFVEGLSVWGRELFRPEDERSPTVIEHERQRSERLLDLWEAEIGHEMLNGPLNMPQIILMCGLQLESLIPDFQWRAGRPNLAAWCDRIGERPSIKATLT